MTINTTSSTDPYLTPDEVCGLVPGMTRGNLAQLRYSGRGPRYRKPSPRVIVYRESEVVAWVESTSRQGTAEDVA